MGLKRNLQIVWDETAAPIGGKHPNPARRYIAKAFSSGSPGWGVYDRKCTRFLKDREVGLLDLVALRQPMTTN